MPRFKVWPCGEQGEDAAAFSSVSTNAAVRNWADQRDFRDVRPLIAQGNELEVFVHELDTGAISRWTVKGRMVRCYEASSGILEVQSRMVEGDDGNPKVCINCPCNMFYDLSETTAACAACHAEIDLGIPR